ncbi:hypothetical protein BCR39DRAFT_590922 [Naematelia encephala]|uniref:G domain-containing protein n=1 Tax=Naematelia encephala TaxID=71784 RepID=A0A1Y2AMA8_9TREE|nr:hypothetical protein BCR39DRAFT_590922 [Naematelia encephala]
MPPIQFHPPTKFHFPKNAPPSWFLGHMAKSVRELPRLLRDTDIVIEARDARLPLSSINMVFEEAVEKAWGHSGVSHISSSGSSSSSRASSRISGSGLDFGGPFVSGSTLTEPSTSTSSFTSPSTSTSHSSSLSSSTSTSPSSSSSPSAFTSSSPSTSSPTSHPYASRDEIPHTSGSRDPDREMRESGDKTKVGGNEEIQGYDGQGSMNREYDDQEIYQSYQRQSQGHKCPNRGNTNLKGKGKQRLMELTRARQKIVVYTKRDLAEAKYEEPLKKAFKALKGETVLFANTKDEADVRSVLNEVIKIAKANRDLIEDTRLLVVGMPNVGKSSLLNSLRNVGVRKAKVFKTGQMAGVTRKHTGTVKIYEDPPIYVSDTPGVMLPWLGRGDLANERSLKYAATYGTKEDLMEGETVAEYLFWRMNRRLAAEQNLPRDHPDRQPTYLDILPLPEGFTKPTLSLDKLFQAMGQRLGLLQKGGITDKGAVMSYFLRLFRDGKIGRWTLDELEQDDSGESSTVNIFESKPSAPPIQPPWESLSSPLPSKASSRFPSSFFSSSPPTSSRASVTLSTFFSSPSPTSSRTSVSSPLPTSSSSSSPSSSSLSSSVSASTPTSSSSSSSASASASASASSLSASSASSASSSSPTLDLDARVARAVQEFLEQDITGGEISGRQQKKLDVKDREQKRVKKLQARGYDVGPGPGRGGGGGRGGRGGSRGRGTGSGRGRGRGRGR